MFLNRMRVLESPLSFKVAFMGQRDMINCIMVVKAYLNTCLLQTAFKDFYHTLFSLTSTLL
jgi:hypothetical protein